MENDMDLTQQQAILASMFEPQSIPPKFMVEIVAKLFAKLKDHYRGAMLTTGEIDWSKNKILEWADYFNQKNATIDELRAAYVLCKDAYKTFPPNEVEFLALARKNNYLDSRQALQIACEMAGKINAGAEVVWDNAIIYETAMRIGFYTLTCETGYILNDRWNKVYKTVCDEADNGAVFELPKYRQIEYTHMPCDKKTALGFLNQAQAILDNFKKQQLGVA